MRSPSGNGGHALAAAGGAGLAASLWLPWYTLHIPQAALNSLTQMSQQFGALGGLIRSGARLISQLGPLHITAWQAFRTVPAVLLVLAIIGGGLALLALSERAGNTSQLTMLASGVAVVLVGYRIAVPPGQGGFVHPAWGAYLAMISSLAMLAGGFLANQAHASEPDLLTLLPTPYPAVSASAVQVLPVDGWSSPSSVPPPAA